MRFHERLTIGIPYPFLSIGEPLQSSSQLDVSYIRYMFQFDASSGLPRLHMVIMQVQVIGGFLLATLDGRSILYFKCEVERECNLRFLSSVDCEFGPLQVNHQLFVDILILA